MHQKIESMIDKWNMPHFIEGATAHYHGLNFIILNTPKSTNSWQDFLFLDNVFES